MSAFAYWLAGKLGIDARLAFIAACAIAGAVLFVILWFVGAL